MKMQACSVYAKKTAVGLDSRSGTTIQQKQPVLDELFGNVHPLSHFLDHFHWKLFDSTSLPIIFPIAYRYQFTTGICTFSVCTYHEICSDKKS